MQPNSLIAVHAIEKELFSLFLYETAIQEICSAALMLSFTSMKEASREKIFSRE